MNEERGVEMIDKIDKALTEWESQVDPSASAEAIARQAGQALADIVRNAAVAWGQSRAEANNG
jgi:hypothetical protein